MRMSSGATLCVRLLVTWCLKLNKRTVTSAESAGMGSKKVFSNERLVCVASSVVSHS